MPINIKIVKDYEYAVDTSVVRASCLKYAQEMKANDPSNHTDFEAIQKTCFETLLSLYNAKIAIDSQGEILSEYKRIAIDNDPQEFASHWFQTMESSEKVVLKDAPLDETLCSEMKNHFNLSKTDCQFVHVAAKTNSLTLLHREKGLLMATGYIKSKFSVTGKHVLK